MYKNRHTEMHIDTCKHPHPHIYIQRDTELHIQKYTRHTYRTDTCKNTCIECTQIGTHTAFAPYTIKTLHLCLPGSAISFNCCTFILLCGWVAHFLYLLIFQWAPIARSLSLISVTVLKYPPKPGACPQVNMMEVFSQSRFLLPRCSCLVSSQQNLPSTLAHYCG